MAEGRQTLGNQQEQDINHAMESHMGVRQQGACSSSGDLTIRIQLPKAKRKEIQISPNATGLQLCKEIANQFAGIEVKCMRLIHRGKILDKTQSLTEQNVKDKAKIKLDLVNEEEREQIQFLSRIKKGAELLAKQDEDFDKLYLKIVNHKGEMIEVPEEKRVIILTALILHEVGRSKMKEGNYQEALEFLDYAETEFRKCDEGQLNSIDNYGLLNLDVTWSNFQKIEHLRDIEMSALDCHLRNAGERLKKAQAYFNNCFGENAERLQQLGDDSGRHKILYLRLHLLWGIYFYHRKLEEDALKELTEAKDQLEELRLDDVDVVCLTNEGFTTREARLALRATGGDMEKARLYIEEKRERAQRQRREAEERRERLRRRAEAAGGLLQESEQQAGGDEGGERLRAGNNPAQVVPDVNSVADQADQVLPQNPSQPVDRTAPSRPPAAISPPSDSENNDEILKEILSFLPLDADDYIDVTLEEEEDLIMKYLAKFPVKEPEEDTPPSPKKKRQTEKRPPPDSSPSDPDEGPTPVSSSSNPPTPEIQPEPKADTVDQADIPDPSTIQNPLEDEENNTDMEEKPKEDFHADSSPNGPGEDPTPVSLSPNPPSPEIQPEPTAVITDQPDIPDPSTIQNPPEDESKNPGLTINDENSNEKEEPKQDFPADSSPSDPDEDPTPVSPYPKPPSPEIQPEPTAGTSDQPDIADPSTIQSSSSTDKDASNITDNPGLTINGDNSNEEEGEKHAKTEYVVTAEEDNLCCECCCVIS